MAGIIARQRKDGTKGYTARVRLRRGQTVLHEEVKTFSSKTAAKGWAKSREVELEDPGSLARAQQGDTSLSSIIRWYMLAARACQPGVLISEIRDAGPAAVPHDVCNQRASEPESAR